MDKQVVAYGDKFQVVHRASEVSQRLSGVPGIDPITATALLASLGDGKASGGLAEPDAEARFQWRQTQVI